jgi:hypothetical protein
LLRLDRLPMQRRFHPRPDVQLSIHWPNWLPR